MIPMSNIPIQPPPDPMPQAPQRPPGRFRWGIIGVIAVVFAFLWFINGIVASFQFEELMSWLGVRHQERYVRLAVLGFVAVLVVMLYKIYKKAQREEK